MNKKLKNKWVKALESGRYKQGRERLAGGGYYCCLGVLRKIEPSIEGEGGSLDVKTSGLPLGKQNRLIAMNDGGWSSPSRSFKEIAKWIRKNI